LLKINHIKSNLQQILTFQKNPLKQKQKNKGIYLK